MLVMSTIGILLEGNYGGGGSLAGLGILTFILACIGLVLGPLSLLIALIISLTKKKEEPQTPAFKVFMKIGLWGLIVGGICLLLTSVFCSWR